MAEKIEKIERTYTIPLRRSWLSTPIYKRTPKAVRAVKTFLQKHMKTKDVKLGKQLNLMLWKKGIRNPPHHVKVTVVKDTEGKATAELFGIKKEGKEEMKKEGEEKKEKEQKTDEKVSTVKTSHEDEGKLKSDEKTSANEEVKKEYVPPNAKKVKTEETVKTEKTE